MNSNLGQVILVKDIYSDVNSDSFGDRSCQTLDSILEKYSFTHVKSSIVEFHFLVSRKLHHFA